MKKPNGIGAPFPPNLGEKLNYKGPKTAKD